jgi:hypothetical protein
MGLWIKGLGISVIFSRVDGLGVRGFRDFVLMD